MNANAQLPSIEPATGGSPPPTLPLWHSAQEMQLISASAELGPTATADGQPDPSAQVVPRGPSRITLSRAVSAGAAETITAYLEPFFTEAREAQVLVLQGGGPPLRINGQRAPRVAVLRPHDLLQWEEGEYQVALFLRPVLGPPPSHLIGVPCPVCRIPFSAEDEECYHCACGTVMHLQKSKPGGLECALVRAPAGCPTCQRALILTGRYALPGGGHG